MPTVVFSDIVDKVTFPVETADAAVSGIGHQHVVREMIDGGHETEFFGIAPSVQEFVSFVEDLELTLLADENLVVVNGYAVTGTARGPVIAQNTVRVENLDLRISDSEKTFAVHRKATKRFRELMRLGAFTGEHAFLPIFHVTPR
jgi:hypothetical protein